MNGLTHLALEKQDCTCFLSNVRVSKGVVPTNMLWRFRKQGADLERARIAQEVSGSPGAPSPPLRPQSWQPCLPSLLSQVDGVLPRTSRVSCGPPRHLPPSLGPPRGPTQATKIGASVPTATHLAGAPGRCRPRLRRCHFDQIHAGEEARDRNRTKR